MSVFNCTAPKLKDITTLEKGKPPAQQPYFGQGAELYLTPEYLRGRSSAETVKPSANAVRVLDGETIVLWDGSNAGEFFRARRGILASTMSRIRHDDTFNTDYFFYAVKNWEVYLKGQTSGSGIPHVDKEVFGKLEIYQFEKTEQIKIAEILSTVDQAIEQTEALIAKQQRIKTGLMLDILTRGIDEHGNLRSEQTHKFKDSPLGRIPVKWTATTLGDIGTWSSGGTPSKANTDFWNGDIPWVSPKDMKSFDLKDTIDKITDHAARFGSTLLPENTILIVIRGMILDHTFPVCYTTRPMAFNQDVKTITAKPGVFARYAAYWLAANEQAILKIVTTATHGTKRFDMNDLYGANIALPEEAEQCRIVQSLDEYQRQELLTKAHVEKLRSLKTALMQDLLTGKRRVTTLLSDKEIDSRRLEV